jgi:hypothetical protein
MLSKNGSNWFSDVSGRQRHCGDLVQQWLEHVVVLTIDHRDLQWIPRCRLSGVQTTESRTDNDQFGQSAVAVIFGNAHQHLQCAAQQVADHGTAVARRANGADCSPWSVFAGPLASAA